jgi:demethylmenaquinone methyltransferase / 2-methoxy-6-polyprenyl-1,4-benzoquinol methylase
MSHYLIMPVSPKKADFVRELFASIAPRYDLLNSILSFNRHKYWRAFAVRQCGLSAGDTALDVGAGTLDFAIELSKAVGESGLVVAVDFCRPMLDIGAEKLRKRGVGNVSLIEGDAEQLPVTSDSFCAATTGFVLRNVESVERTIAEMTRAVRPGGKVVCLELAKPKGRLFGPIYNLYFNRVLPCVGGIVNRRRGPYDYLPASLKDFCSREELAGIMKKVGLDDIRVRDLTGGVVAVHVGTKKLVFPHCARTANRRAHRV